VADWSLDPARHGSWCRLVQKLCSCCCCCCPAGGGLADEHRRVEHAPLWSTTDLRQTLV